MWVGLTYYICRQARRRLHCRYHQVCLNWRKNARYKKTCSLKSLSGSNFTEKLVTWSRFLVVSGAIRMIVSVVAVVDRTFPRSEPANAIILVITVHAGWALVCRRRKNARHKSRIYDECHSVIEFGIHHKLENCGALSSLDTPLQYPKYVLFLKA